VEKKRIWEIDYLRVIAIVLMIIYHTAYDLNEFAGRNINLNSEFWVWYCKLASPIFPFLSGVSSGFSEKGIVQKGLKILLVGLGITVVTFFILGDQFIRYGVLHFLGTCMLLYPLLSKLNVWLLAVLAATVASLAKPLGRIDAGTGLLLPLGIKYQGFSTVDYYPLVPYLAAYIVGIIAYKLYYYKKQSLFSFSLENKFFTAISRNSLWIYLLHQPILLGAIYLYNQLLSWGY